MFEEGSMYCVEVPEDTVHLSVHGDGKVHIRADGSGRIFRSAVFPPLRDLAAPTYVLEIHPAPLATYPLADDVRPGDVDVDVAAVELAGFAVGVAVGAPRKLGDPHRASIPTIEAASGQVRLQHVRKVVGELEFQLAILSLAKGEKPYFQGELWRIIEPGEPGDALPRPWGGTLHPTQWEADSGK